MKVRCVLCALIAFTTLFTLRAGAQETPLHPQPAPISGTQQPTSKQITQAPVRALPIKDFKLLSQGTGWVSTGSRLLLTTDNGAHWKDISPRVPALSDSHDQQFTGVFFLDVNTGWLLYSTDTDDTTADGHPVLYDTRLASTVDGGATWTTVSQLPRPDPWQEVTGGGFLVFSDRLHGWVDLGTIRSGVLFATSDGGRTWHSPKSQPGIDSEMVAPTDKDLWMAGGMDDKLFVTHDGGNTVQEVSLPVPAGIDREDYPSYDLPVFTDRLNGYEQVDYSGGDKDQSAVALFATTDGGHTWNLDRVLSNLAPAAGGGHRSSAIAGSSWIFSFAPEESKTTLLKLHPNDRKAASVNEKGRDNFNGCKLSFTTPDEGWMNCSGVLSSTIDGGASWTAVTPRARNGVLTPEPITPLQSPKLLNTHPVKLSRPKIVPNAAIAPASGGTQSGIDQHLGFDSSNVLSSGDMAIWWNSSPYYDVGFYLPNSPNRHNDPTLVAHKEQGGIDWISAVTAQGWGLFPVWFGLQPPCANATFPKTGYISVGAAAAQGAEQADLAYASATNLGLDGAVVYFDIESICKWWNVQ